MTLAVGSLSSWIAYSEARGNSAPGEADQAVALQALLRTQDYIFTHYVYHFYDLAIEDDTAMLAIETAMYAAARYELETPWFFYKTYTPSEIKVLTEVKGIKWTPVQSPYKGQTYELLTPVSTMVEAILNRWMGDHRRIHTDEIRVQSIGG